MKKEADRTLSFLTSQTVAPKPIWTNCRIKKSCKCIV